VAASKCFLLNIVQKHSRNCRNVLGPMYGNFTPFSLPSISLSNLKTFSMRHSKDIGGRDCDTPSCEGVVGGGGGCGRVLWGVACCK